MESHKGEVCIVVVYFIVKILIRKHEKDLAPEIQYCLHKVISFEVFKLFLPLDAVFTCFEDGCL